MAIKEVEFWAVNNEAPLNVALLKVFTELSCSELKADASDSDIAALPAYFRTIAQRMKAGTYQREFRIDSYKAFSDPDKFARLRNTNPYNLYDNPMGIYANVGDEIYILVGETNDRAISLYSVSPASMGNSRYQLKEGINKIKIDRAGLLYVNYIADLTTNPEPIKVHIPEGSGIVNGYWDVNKHTGAQWRGILEKATHSVIDIVGNYAMAIMYTDVLRQNLAFSDDISKSMEIWDGVVKAGWDFMGFDKYPLPQNSRMLMLSVEIDGHMYATSYHTGYNKPTLINEVLYPGVAGGNRLWGIGHEVGHCQQHPFNYRSMSESSNNTFSQLVLDEVINKMVRKIDENDINSLKKAASDMIPACDGLSEVAEGKANHDIDGWSKWGGAYYVFHLYFNKLGINPDFYKDIFESLRQNGLGDASKAGPAQLNWYKRVCDIAKIDFTEHFEKNGFFVPIDKEGNQYGPYTIIVSQADADAAKAYVAS